MNMTQTGSFLPTAGNKQSSYGIVNSSFPHKYGEEMNKLLETHTQALAKMEFRRSTDYEDVLKDTCIG